MSPMHTCPGGCKKRVPNSRFACGPCWDRLPRELQTPIRRTAKMSLLSDERSAAVSAAIDFYYEDAQQ